MVRVSRAFLDRFHALDAKDGEAFGTPPSRKLSLLVRPVFVARKGKTYVWCDWSAIEARVLPWLAASRGAEAVLDVFRANDADPSKPDLYEVEASNTYGIPPEEIKALYKANDPEGVKMRQIGKVETLSFGFGGSVGAITAMGANYGVYVDPARAKELVDTWRANNRWAPAFWGRHNSNESYGIWGAACRALQDPDTAYPVGRVTLVYDRVYLGGTLFVVLPDGRPLTYPAIRWEEREVEDTFNPGTLVTKTVMTFRKQHFRSVLWHGKFAENFTQGLAGSILRKTLVKLEYEAENDVEFRSFMPVVGHTHDEIVTEVDEEIAPMVKSKLHDIMVEGFDWSEGLPLAAEAGSNWYYTKAKVK